MITFILFLVIPVLGLILSVCFISSNKNLKILGWGGLVFVTVALGLAYDVWASVFMLLAFFAEMLWFVTEKNEKIGIKDAFLKLFLYLKI